MFPLIAMVMAPSLDVTELAKATSVKFVCLTAPFRQWPAFGVPGNPLVSFVVDGKLGERGPWEVITLLVVFRCRRRGTSTSERQQEVLIGD